MTRLTRKFAALGAATVATLMVGSGFSTADAAPPGTLKVVYDVVGTSHIARAGTDTNIGPTTLTSYVNQDGSFRGSLPIPPARSCFYVGHLLNCATANYIPVGAVKGRILGAKKKRVVSHSRYIIKLTDATISDDHHTHSIDIGDNCMTVSPVAIKAATPPGQSFDLTNGGPLAGVYTIPEFDNCRGAEHIITDHTSGPGNTVTLNVSNGRSS